MKKLLLLLALALPLAGAETAPVPPPVFPSEIRLASGATLRNTTPVRWTADAVVVKHSGGADPIRFAHMTEASRAAVLAAKPGANPAPAQAPTPVAAPTARKITGEAFLGGGESQSVRVKFAGLAVVAYPQREAMAALETNTRPDLPAPIAQAVTDSEGRFELELPSGTPVLIMAKGVHRAVRGNRTTEWEWRVPYVEGDRVMLHDGNAYGSPQNGGTVSRR